MTEMCRKSTSIHEFSPIIYGQIASGNAVVKQMVCMRLPATVASVLASLLNINNIHFKSFMYKATLDQYNTNFQMLTLVNTAIAIGDKLLMSITNHDELTALMVKFTREYFSYFNTIPEFSDGTDPIIDFITKCQHIAIEQGVHFEVHQDVFEQLNFLTKTMLPMIKWCLEWTRSTFGFGDCSSNTTRWPMITLLADMHQQTKGSYNLGKHVILQTQQDMDDCNNLSNILTATANTTNNENSCMQEQVVPKLAVRKISSTTLHSSESKRIEYVELSEPIDKHPWSKDFVIKSYSCNYVERNFLRSHQSVCTSTVLEILFN